jgi:hypothetical protein
MTQNLNVSVFDLVSKIIPGATFLTGIILLMPSNLGIVEAILKLGTTGAVLITAVSYGIGIVIQGKSSEWFTRRRYFESWMSDTRQSVEKVDTDPLETKGGDHIERAVWTDIFRRFEIPQKFVAESSPEYDERHIKKPVSYKFFMKPILLFLSYVSTVNQSDIDNYPPLYTVEEFAYQSAESYLTDNNIGNLSRFEYLFLVNRSFALLSPVLFILFLISSILSLLNIYTPILNSPVVMVILSVLSFYATSVFFNGMLHWERIRDKNILETYFASVLDKDLQRSD